MKVRGRFYFLPGKSVPAHLQVEQITAHAAVNADKCDPRVVVVDNNVGAGMEPHVNAAADLVRNSVTLRERRFEG